MHPPTRMTPTSPGCASSIPKSRFCGSRSGDEKVERMIDHKVVAAWLENYVRAWKTYDPDAIRALFSEDARYAYSPFDEPLVGREAIVASWLEDQDQPGEYDAHYAPVAVDGMTAVANGRSQYFAPGSKTVGAEFDNIFVLRFDDQGRCTDFREWFMKRT